MPTVTRDEKRKAVIQQRKLFTDYIARLSREGKLTQEQDKAAMHATLVLDAVIEDYSDR